MIPQKHCAAELRNVAICLGITRHAGGSLQVGAPEIRTFWERSAIPSRLQYKRRRQILFRRPAYVGCPLCSLKIEFSFLNGNLMVQAGHRIIFGAAQRRRRNWVS
jgi:hypothetical protein